MCFLQFLILLCCVEFVEGDEWCRSIRTRTSSASSMYEYTSFVFCEYGCCGSDYSRKCCDAGVSVGLVIGIIVAVIVFVGGTVILIFCVCCLNTKTTRSRGNIIAPTPLQQQNGIYTTNPAWFPSAKAHPYPDQVYTQRNSNRTEPTQASATPPLDPPFPPARSTLLS